MTFAVNWCHLNKMGSRWSPPSSLRLGILLSISAAPQLHPSQPVVALIPWSPRWSGDTWPPVQINDMRGGQGQPSSCLVLRQGEAAWYAEAWTSGTADILSWVHREKAWDYKYSLSLSLLCQARLNLDQYVCFHS